MNYRIESIAQLQNLNYLNVSNNQLEYLPETIGNLKNLEHLNLIGNRLTQLPQSIGNLCGLKSEIDAYDNPLNGLPESASKLQVQILY
ncbi:leucine-rich repeat domain-containing protein [Plectonema cf. radiosum LEGE 06105]|uniref:Leucine-rich repeat domain-containing protein n=1 Tax=Plectonema cf. radiosum LEGE 06105 TaxID=945769 RepID=A0A8J7F5N4_9CYAN|nr:leucine-rich repeat domain-containing protein [Plectonema radiosum]MBE9215760.1 leucine-rich repeat domain-containing protein [Plectonema cf. radiosum LEGE 06105]